MKLIDTHAHLQFEAYDKDRDKVVKRNAEKLDFLINVGAKFGSSKAGVDLAQKVGNFYAGIGIHPHHVDKWTNSWIEKLETLSKNPKTVAIGEIGLDKHEYHGFPKPNIKKQKDLLVAQIELARKLDLPILFHCREAYDDLLDMIKSYNSLSGLIHCFMGTTEQAKKFLSLGLHISFSGNLTYKGNGYIRDSAKIIPSDKILLETDAPYLPPEPHRGTRNEPYMIEYTARVLATERKESFEKISEETNKNSRLLFKLT